jgi:hypothetical protein
LKLSKKVINIQLIGKDEKIKKDLSKERKSEKNIKIGRKEEQIKEELKQEILSFKTLRKSEKKYKDWKKRRTN